MKNIEYNYKNTSKKQSFVRYKAIALHPLCILFSGTYKELTNFQLVEIPHILLSRLNSNLLLDIVW